MRRNEKQDEDFNNKNGDAIETQIPLLETKSPKTEMVATFQSTDATQAHTTIEENICFSLTGEWGWWQCRTAMIVYLTKIPAAWFMACVIFTAPYPRQEEFQCNITSVLNDLGLSQNHSYYHPLVVKPDGSYREDFCNVVINTSNSQEAVACNHFSYNIHDKTSLVTQFDLVCSNNILVAITQCFHLFGVLLGGIIATELMKCFSPRRVMMLGMVFQIILGICTGYAPLFWLHVVFRCMVAAASAVTYTAGNAIMLSITGGKYKTIIAANFEQFWSVGVVLLAVIGYFVSYWGEIYVTITLPTILIVILWWFLPDSPIWHLKKENINIAKDILLRGNKINKRKTKIPDHLDDLLKRKAMDIICEASKETQSGWKQLFSINGSTWRILCLATGWSLVYTCYYGALLNIRSFGREYLIYTTAIAGVSELTGGFIGFVSLMTLKHKWAFVGFVTALSGLINCFIWLLPTHVDGSHMLVDLMIIQMINKIGISAALCVLYTCTAELFPPHHKVRVVYACTVTARIVFMTAPLIGYTAIFGDGVSLTAFGGLTVLIGLSMMFLKPLDIRETNNQTNIFSININNRK